MGGARRSVADFAGPPKLDEDYLILSTVHSAKGLEWDAVHLIAAYNGNFPADMSHRNPGGHHRGATPLLVALTRARRGLHVYVPERFYYRQTVRDQRHGYGKPSRFLTEPVQRLFQTRVPPTPPRDDRSSTGPRIEVSVDALFA